MYVIQALKTFRQGIFMYHIEILRSLFSKDNPVFFKSMGGWRKRCYRDVTKAKIIWRIHQFINICPHCGQKITNHHHH